MRRADRRLRTTTDALLCVRNDAVHDARVARAARTLAEMGMRPTVLAVQGATPRPAREVVDGVEVIRLPQLPALRRWRDRLARVRPAIRSGVPGAADADAPAADPASRAGARARLRRALVSASYGWRAARVVRRRRPALVHCNDLNTLWVGAAARALAPGAAVVYDAHELWPDRNQRPEWRPWLLACEALLSRLAHARITASPGYARELARRYRLAPPVVVRNIPAAAPSRATPPAGAPPTAVYVGGLLRHRGLEQAIDAIALVDGVRLRLVGPVQPAYAAELRARAERRGVAGRVELASPVAPDAVVAAIGGAHVGLALIQPVCRSYELTLPNKLLEYVLAGVPVLASDLEVMRAFVLEHDVGRVTSPADPRAIARDLEALLAPQAQARHRAAAARAQGRLRWADEQRVLEGVYRRALELAA